MEIHYYTEEELQAIRKQLEVSIEKAKEAFKKNNSNFKIHPKIQAIRDTQNKKANT